MSSGFSYLKLHPTRRLFLVFYAAGYTVDEALGMMPKENGSDDGEVGLGSSTFRYWRSSDPLFAQCMKEIEEDPDWCHENIVAPWSLAQDDLMQIQKMLGHKTNPDRPWFGLSAKQRELLLNERGKLNREESTADKFLQYMMKMDKRREQRELAEAKQQALPKPSITIIDSQPGQHNQEYD